MKALVETMGNYILVTQDYVDSHRDRLFEAWRGSLGKPEPIAAVDVTMAILAKFDESKHKRAADGKFGSGGGGKKSKGDKGDKPSSGKPSAKKELSEKQKDRLRKDWDAPNQEQAAYSQTQVNDLTDELMLRLSKKQKKRRDKTVARGRGDGKDAWLKGYRSKFEKAGKLEGKKKRDVLLSLSADLDSDAARFRVAAENELDDGDVDEAIVSETEARAHVELLGEVMEQLKEFGL